MKVLCSICGRGYRCGPKLAPTECRKCGAVFVSQERLERIRALDRERRYANEKKAG